ncbi:MAG: hypothetical protein JRJ59_00220, partial [Deltaproteobacteria bacterium]|nr:hypothetical protein [Deltaproteobacteria bacterium]
MEVNTTGFKGHIRESARVQLNDPERPSILLSLEVDVRPVFNITPRRRFFLKTVVGRPVEQSLRLEAALDQPVRITGLDHPFGEDLKTEIEE